MQIKELAEHASVTTTQRYMHLAPGNADEAIGLLEKARSSSGFGDILETGKARA